MSHARRIWLGVAPCASATSATAGGVLAAQREVGDEDDPLAGAVVDLVVVRPRDEAVLVLHGGDRRD